MGRNLIYIIRKSFVLNKYLRELFLWNAWFTDCHQFDSFTSGNTVMKTEKLLIPILKTKAIFGVWIRK
jgi:hypothetical protein